MWTKTTSLGCSLADGGLSDAILISPRPPFRDVASGADRHHDIGLQVVKSSSLVSVLFREVFSHPYIFFFHLLVNGFSIMKLIFLPA